MKRMSKFFLTIALMASVLPAVLANPVQVYTEPDPRQDTWVLDGWVEELGTGGFPSDELISAQQVGWTSRGGHIPCPTDYQGGLCAQVQIVNLTGKKWTELYYVADEGTSLSNVDELVGDVSFPGTQLAFRIDNDPLSQNTPLVFESMTPDGIFEIGETWEFVIQDYWWFDPAAGSYTQSGADLMGSLGVAMASGSFSTGDVLSSGSIVAIPEPSVAILIAMVGSGMIFIRRLMM